MRLKQYFNPDLRKAVQEYHLVQRDKHLQIVRWICDPDGYSALLVRFEDEQGNKTSALMGCDAPCGPDDDWDVREIGSCRRADEHCLTQGYMMDGGFEPDDTECEDE